MSSVPPFRSLAVCPAAGSQGYLAHKKTPPPPRNPLGPQAQAYGLYIKSEVPLYRGTSLIRTCPPRRTTVGP